MSINNVRLLRSLIREMVTEAPYRSSQRVVLGGVQFDGTPDIRGTLMAGGAVGLIKLYGWASGVCDITADNNTFPIKLSKPAAAKIVDSRADKLASADWAGYMTAIQVAPVPTAPSDTARLLSFYNELKAAAAEWPRGSGNYTQLNTSAAATANTQASVFEKLKTILKSYTGCDTLKIAAMPMSTRSEYIDFLKNIGLNAKSTFETNLTAQRDAMTSQYPNDTTTINKEVNGIVRIAKTQWTSRILPNLQ